MSIGFSRIFPLPPTIFLPISRRYSLLFHVVQSEKKALPEIQNKLVHTFPNTWKWLKSRPAPFKTLCFRKVPCILSRVCRDDGSVERRYAKARLQIVLRWPAHSTHQDLSTPQSSDEEFPSRAFLPVRPRPRTHVGATMRPAIPWKTEKEQRSCRFWKEGCSKLFSNSGRYVTLNAEHISHPPGISVPTFVPAHVADMPCRRRSAVSSEAAQKFAGTGFAPLRRESC